MQITLDTTLEQNPDGLKFDKEKFINEFCDGDVINNTVDTVATHRNFLEYLEVCYSNHYGYVISPEIIWHMILAESAEHIKEFSDQYAHLFTDTPDSKKEITVMNDGSDVLNLNAIITELLELIPSDVSAFLPEFSTDTLESRFAHSAAFCDAMSPYYNYSMLLCGFPSVTVNGTVDDWHRVKTCFIEVMNKLTVIDSESLYVTGVIRILDNIIDSYDNPDEHTDFYNNILFLKPCGSGHQVEVSGWISGLFLKQPRPKYVNNFSTHVSKVEYKCLNTNRDFKIHAGLFNSKLENDVLVPSYANVVYRLPENEEDENLSC